MKKVILVADDSPTIRKFVSISLKVKGFEIIQVADGMQALEILPSEPVDLIITDLNMPNVVFKFFLPSCYWCNQS